MTRKRTIATMAAFGGLTAAVALLSGQPAAKADELSDLRANQQLLQQRLDQLAQIPSPTGVYPGGPPAPSAGAGMVGGSFPRSFLVPGTDTSIRVGGTIAETADYFFSGGNPNQGCPWNTTLGVNGQAQAIPLNIHVPTPPGGAGTAKARGNSIFGQSPRESKVYFESRTPTAWGEARTYMEFDWAGSNPEVPGGANPTSVSDNLHPRLRFAYATLGGLLAGQANSNFSDADASAEAIDFGGTFGDPGVVRIPQVRYTMPLAPWGFLGALSVSAETPETDAWLPATGIIGQDATSGANAPSSVANTGFNPLKTPAPDLTAAWYVPQPWGHFDFSAVVRPVLQFQDGNFVNRSYTGWGVHFGGDVKPGWFGWNRDTITWHFVYGDAIGRYLNTSSGFALVSNYPAAVPGTAAAAANVLVKPTVAWGGNVGYRHDWLPNLRSTISGGIYHHDINDNLRTVTAAGTTTGVSAVCASTAAATGGGGCGLNKELVNAHVNLIWNPVPFADIGIEYTWAHRIVVSNLKGDMNALISRFRVNF